MSSSPFSSSSSSRTRKPVLFLPSLRSKLLASFHAYKNSDPSRLRNGMTTFRRSSLQRLAPGFNSYDKLDNPSDLDEEDPPTSTDLQRNENENENENARLKSSSTDYGSSSIPRSNNKQRSFMKRFRKSSRRRMNRRRRFRVLSCCKKFKWLFSPLWLLKKLIRIYGSLFYIDPSSQAPILLMGMHLSVPPSPLPPIT